MHCSVISGQKLCNIPDELDMENISMEGTGLKKGTTWKLHNGTDLGCPQECVGDCDKVGMKNDAKE